MQTTNAEGKGWNWLMAAACFCTMFTTIGVLRISGVLYTNITEVYNVSREEAAWPFYVRRTVAMFAALFVGFLSQFFSNRTQVIVGILLSSAGVGLCYFAKSVLFITLTFGILYGCGSGIVRTSNVITINTHFSQYRTVATGVIYCGNSIGSFVFPPLTEFLIDTYGLRGSFLITSGLLLQGLIAAILYKRSKSKDKLTPEITSPASEEIDENILENQNRRRLSFEAQKQKEHFSDNKDIKKLNSEIQKSSEEGNSIQIYKKPDIKLRNEKNDCQLKSNEDQRDKSTDNKCAAILRCYLGIFKYPMFYIINASSTVISFSFYTYLTIIVDYAIDCGISKHKSIFFLSVCSFAELFGRLGCGWIIDLGFLKRTSVLWISYVGLAVIFTITPLLNSYELLMTYACFVGFFASCLIINNSVLYSEYLGLDNLPYAVGVGTTFNGISTFFLPVVIGYCRDSTGSYDLLFYGFGVIHLFVGILWLLEPIVANYQRRLFSSS